MNGPLSYLTEADWQALRARKVALRFERDQVIVRQGDGSRGVMILARGSARVAQDREGVAITLARMGPGEVFGEMSLLEDTAASATVTADEPSEIDLFERDQIEALLRSDPGFSARFHRSLAVHLSQRLRERSKRIAELDALATARLGRAHTTRLGHVTSRQLPPPLVAGIDAFGRAMTAIEAKPGPDAYKKVSDACEELLALLSRAIEGDSLFEVGYADLSSFRDPAALAVGIGGYVFRRTFSWFMSAATLARLYMKPRGFAEDHATLALIDEDDPDGDGVVGPLLDKWFLARPVCRARRAGRDEARDLIRRAAEGAAQVSVLSLASGSAFEAIDLLADFPSLRLTCMDLDHEALASGAARANDLGAAARVAFVHGDVVPREGSQGPSIGRHDVVYALGLFEYLSDDACARLVGWAYDLLVPGGTLMITTLAKGAVDEPFLEHILEWHMIPRHPGDVAALLARSRFGGSPRVHVEDAHLSVEVVKPS